MPRVTRRALVVGIDDYASNPLHGCVNDATNVAALLREHADGAPNFNVKVMTAPSQQVTRSALREGLAALFGDASDCDVALLYFAGHGTENDLGGYLVTQDIQKYDEGIALTEVLTLANQSQARERIIILDSCLLVMWAKCPQVVLASLHYKKASQSSRPRAHLKVQRKSMVGESSRSCFVARFKVEPPTS